jgi:hypothetical protein
MRSSSAEVNSENAGVDSGDVDFDWGLVADVSYIPQYVEISHDRHQAQARNSVPPRFIDPS